MTSSGRRWAFLIGVVIAFMIPKRVDCGYPGAECVHKPGCAVYEVEPWGFFLIEYVAGRDVGFAYSSGEDCH